jgi:hypothetical protein
MDEQDVSRYEPVSLCGLQSLAVYFLRGSLLLCAVQCSVRLDMFGHDHSMKWVQAVKCRLTTTWLSGCRRWFLQEWSVSPRLMASGDCIACGVCA